MRWVIPPVLAILLAAAPSHAQEAKEKAVPAASVPSERLPVLGTVGDLPPEKERLVVAVDARGRLSVDGKGADLASLKALLLDRADEAREEKEPKASALHVVLRADRDLPWQGAQWLMQACAEPRTKVYRILFAACPEDGGREGAMATFLPKDAGIEQAPRNPPVKVPVRLQYDETEIPVVPGDLYPSLLKNVRRDGQSPPQVEIDAAPDVPTGQVLEAVDMALRWGAGGVVFRGTRLLKDTGIEEAVAALPPRKAGLVLTVLGNRILPPGKDAPKPPPVARKAGGLAGLLEAGPIPVVEGKVIEEPAEEPK